MDESSLEAMRRGAGIAIDGEGRFTSAGRLVEHPRVQKLFHAGLAIREDGEVILRVGPWWCYVTTAGVAFFVEALRRNADSGTWSAALAGGREVPVAGATLGYAPDARFYLWADGLPGPAILLRDAHMQLAGHLVTAREGDPVLGAEVVTLSEAPGLRTPRPVALP